MNTTKKKYGTRLKERRESLGLSIQDVFEQTRVPIQYILAFENETFEILSTNPNIWAFLSSYCQYINIDPRPYYDLYLEWLRTQNSTNKRKKTSNQSAQSEAIELPPWLEPLITWGIVCAVLILSWLAYSFFTKPIREDPSLKVNAGSVEAPIVHFEEE
ncbi:MAG TPA: helix-turn-helix domain-containing protein [Candidatus Hydrogenedens sp.]|nr:helix-turn-helix domain-containing protein [Candidatus Hydrogenedens sp.]